MKINKIKIHILFILVFCFVISYKTDTKAQEYLNYEDDYVDLIQEGNYGTDEGKETVEFYSSTDYTEVKAVIKKGLLDVSDSIDIKDYQVPKTDIRAIYQEVINENPELFFVSGGYSYYYTTSGYIGSLIPYYISDSKDEIKAMKVKFDESVDKLTKEIDEGLTDVDKALEVHNYIASHAKYNTDAYNAGTLTEIDHSAYGILVDHTGVCDGYSLAYRYIMKGIYNIDTVVVTSTQMSHAWNLIKIGDSYYHVDLTWDDGTMHADSGIIYYNVGYRYFLLSDEAITSMSNPHYGWEDIGIKCDNTYYDNMSLHDYDFVFYGTGGYYDGVWHTVDAFRSRLTELNMNTFESKTYQYLDNLTYFCTYAVDKDTIYYASLGTNKIYSCDFTGANSKLVATVDKEIHAIGFENGYLNYCCDDYTVYTTDIKKTDSGEVQYDKLDRVLTVGSTGDDVKKVQQYLKNVGYLDSVVDGSYGNATKAAVIMFQANEELNVSGDVDNDTYTKMQQTDRKFSALKKGMNGNAVKVMQTYLAKLGYNVGTVDGGFGSVTVEAVKKFQSINGLYSDGEAGLKTLAVLYGASPKSYVEIKTLDRTLTVGSTGSDVKEVQQYLKNLGYLDSVVDGSYGNATKAAAKIFQANEGLYVDGEIGNASYKVMQQTSKKFTALKKGMSGNAVKVMQTYLINLGYLDSVADGGFGAVTEAALKKFQSVNGLYADGEAGIKTLKVLYGVSPKANADIKKLNRTLKVGSTGSDVKEVQQYLKNLGYLDSVVDGSYGNATKTAAKIFQANENLYVDGEIGNASYKVMQQTSKKFKALKNGMSGNAVKVMQTYLINLGYLDSVADGRFGAVTKAAVIKFQKDNGLYADGEAGIKTLSVLYMK